MKKFTITNPIKKKSGSWRSRYITLLRDGFTDDGPESRSLAAELIDAGYARGNVLISHSTPGRTISRITWAGATQAGREYLDTLEDREWRHSMLYHLKAALLSGGSMAAGALITVAVQAWLGAC